MATDGPDDDDDDDDGVMMMMTMILLFHVATTWRVRYRQVATTLQPCSLAVALGRTQQIHNALRNNIHAM